MNTLDIAISCGLTPERKCRGNKGQEYCSPCPMCGGTDRFIIWPEAGEHGGWYCRMCDLGGDGRELLKKAKGMTDHEACAYLGLEETVAPRNHSPRAPKKKDTWKPRETTAPAELWRKKATAFCDMAHDELLKNREPLDYLQGRGITEESVRRFRLGWNPKDLFRKKTAWGIADNGKKLWLPKGIVIPYFNGDALHHIRIRKAELRNENDPRYHNVHSTGMAAYIIRPTDPPRGKLAVAVIEADLDGILVAQEAGDVVGVCALGNSSSKPDTAAAAFLQESCHIMNGLDFDVAGGKCWLWWKKNYNQAERWPVPEGKDPGEYFQKGGDIRKWILAGLPIGLKPGLRPPVPETAPEPAPREPKIPAPADDPIALTPMVYVARKCTDCNKPVKILTPKDNRHHQERVPCWKCLLKIKQTNKAA